MKGIIIAAGIGTRLQPYTSLMPKPLLPVGRKPCVRYIVERLERSGIKDIILCVNESFLPMFEHEFRDRNITFVTSSEPLGTGGELLNCKHLIDSDFLVHYGDELTDIDFSKLIQLHEKKNAFGTLAVLEKFPLPVGLVETRKNEITGFREKHTIDLQFWVGIAILKKEVLNNIELGEDLAIDIFPKLLKNGKKLYAETFDSEWIDIGNISRYKHAVSLAERGLIR